MNQPTDDLKDNFDYWIDLALDAYANGDAIEDHRCDPMDGVTDLSTEELKEITESSHVMVKMLRDMYETALGDHNFYVVELQKRNEPPKTKPCTSCMKGTMELFEDVEHDERRCGDPEDGDYELGSTRTLYYECNNKMCKESEVLEQEFKGSGMLR